MKDNNLNKKILNVLAILLLTLVIFNITVSFLHWQDGWTEILWYCDSAAILLSLGVLFRRTAVISAILISAIPAQFLWILDFILKVFGFEGFGRTAELFTWPLITILPSILVHLLLIPLAFYAVYIYGFNKKGVLISLILLFFSMVLPFYFSAYDDNINCVFYPCDLTFDQAAYSGIPQTIDYFSLGYLLFITIRWFVWIFIIYFWLLFLFRRIFKRFKVL